LGRFRTFFFAAGAGVPARFAAGFRAGFLAARFAAGAGVPARFAAGLPAGFLAAAFLAVARFAAGFLAPLADFFRSGPGMMAKAYTKNFAMAAARSASRRLLC
jgi:hypothetical protein